MRMQMQTVRVLVVLVLIASVSSCRSSRETVAEEDNEWNWLQEYQDALDSGDKPHQSVTDLILQELRKEAFLNPLEEDPLQALLNRQGGFAPVDPAEERTSEEPAPLTMDDVLAPDPEAADQFRSLVLAWVEAEDQEQRDAVRRVIEQNYGQDLIAQPPPSYSATAAIPGVKEAPRRFFTPQVEGETPEIRETVSAISQVLDDRDITKQILRNTIQQTRDGTIGQYLEDAEGADWTTEPVMSHIRNWWVTRDILFDSTAALRYTPGDPAYGEVDEPITMAMEDRLRQVQSYREVDGYPELVRQEEMASADELGVSAFDRNRRIYSWDAGPGRGASADQGYEDPNARSLGRRVGRGQNMPSLINGVRRTGAFKVFGYHPWWMRDTWQQYDYSVLDKVIFFDVHVNDQAGFENLQGWPSQWQGMIQTSQRNGTQVVPTVALLDNTPQFINIFRSNTLTAALLRNTMDLVRRANADGIHLDFEIFSNVPPEAKNGFTRYVALLRDELKTYKPDAQLTVFVTAFDHADALDEVALARYADHLIVQGYDMHWLTAPNAGPLGPLTGWNGANWENILNRFLGMGVPREKIVMAVPYYGYEWPTVSDQPGAATRGAGREVTYAPVDPSYLPLIQINVKQRVGAYGMRRDPATNMPYYAYQGADGWYQGWFEDAQSLQAKYDFVKRQRLGGIAIFPLGYDGGELNSVLVNALR